MAKNGLQAGLAVAGGGGGSGGGDQQAASAAASRRARARAADVSAHRRPCVSLWLLHRVAKAVAF